MFFKEIMLKFLQICFSMRICLSLFFLFIAFVSVSQEKDSLNKTHPLIPNITTASDSNTVFEGKKGLHASHDETAKLIIGGYVSTYFGIYDDETVNNGFVQIPTMAARNKEFGINTALVSMKYSAKNLRGNLGIHYGDIATTVWPSQYNMIQEANAGVKLVKKLWLDAGFFKSHIGVESTEPRENITSSMAMADNFEPYYFAGAKLTYEVSDQLLLQVNSFNSYATFVDNNKNKLIGTSIVYSPTSKISMTYNFLTGTETPDSVKTKQVRNYNNFYITYSSNKFLLALEANYGWQTNSSKKDSTKNVEMFSGLIVGKYQAFPKFAVYARQEYFSDYDQMVTGSIDFGRNMFGTTFGFEFKPFKNAAISIEGRNLSCDNLIFKQGDKVLNQRNELIFCFDIWF